MGDVEAVRGVLEKGRRSVMARMSVDDMVARDPRITLLASQLKWSRRETVGCLIADVWPICYDQRTWLLSERVIDAAAGQDGFAKALIECELATVDRSGKVCIKGAKERIKYLDHKTAAGREGGLKSAESRRKTPKQTSSNGGSTPQAAGNPPVPSPASASVPPKEEEILSGKPDLAAEIARTAVSEINRRSGARYEADSKSVAKLSKALAKAKHTPEEVVRVVEFKASWLNQTDKAEYFRPSTLLALENFEKYLDEIKAGPLFARGTQVRQMPSSDDDEPDLSYAGCGIGESE